jgi:hypothetical protein
MKTRLFSVCILVVGLTLALTWAVTAQQQQPESGGAPSRDGLGVRATSAVTLGQPGLSFRYVQTFGETMVPYVGDSSHLNYPTGLFIDGSNRLFVAEEAGVLGFSPSGTHIFTVGQAGGGRAGDMEFLAPWDIAVDSDGYLWLAAGYQVIQFDIATGEFQQSLPIGDGDPAIGIAFATNYMFVGEWSNHRVQVCDVDGINPPVCANVIGETGVPGNDNTHFDTPSRLATDGDNRLYVLDGNNDRIQRCETSDNWATWSCNTFLSGLAQGAAGLATDSSGNVFVADSNNGRVLKCSASGSCTELISSLGYYVKDVAADSSGNVYLTDWTHCVVRKYDNQGQNPTVFVGVEGVPYVPDDVHLNGPWGLAVGPDGSIYITEGKGYRLVKLNAAGVQQWTVGEAGVWGDDNAHFGGWWAWLESNPAMDAAGRIYVPDTANNRIQIFSSNGTYYTTFGSGGNGQYGFDYPRGIAISPVNGDIYIIDGQNQRVQVYNSSRVYKTTLGVTDVPGSDNQHFNGPYGVAVDANGNIYVADEGNRRVQKCALSGSSYTCATFAGMTGELGSDFDHLWSPYAVAVDVLGRVYIADAWGGDNHRIQIFDSTGAYLTTIGGSWGSNTGQMRVPTGVAVDTQGNVYVADLDNHRIQKFAPGVPGWRQVNINGFGERYNTGVFALEAFNGQMYAGTGNWSDGTRVWRTSDGTTWTAVSELGFGSAYTNTNPVVIDMIVFKGQLYASTGWDEVGGQIWRSPDGTTWTQVEGNGFGDATNGAIAAFGIFGDTLYVATHSFTDAHGCEIWRSSTGDSLSWTNVVTNGNGSPNNYIATGLIEFSGYFYAGVENGADGAEIWRTSDGVTWARVITSGFGDPDNTQTGGFAILGGYLYIGTQNNTTGAQIWRSSDGTTWTQVVGDGFGDPNNYKIESLAAFDGALYAGTDNNVTGIEIWRSTDSVTWEQVNVDGFGDSNNDSTLWSSATAVFDSRLFIGTGNWGNGGEVWQFVGYPVYLPLIVRNR